MKIIYPLLFILALALSYFFFVKGPLQEDREIDKKIVVARQYLDNSPGTISKKDIISTAENNKVEIIKFSVGPPAKARLDGSIVNILGMSRDLEKEGIIALSLAGKGPYKISLSRQK